MANQLRLQVILETLDRASAPFRSINAQASRMARGIRQSNTHLRAMQNALRGVQTQQMARQSRGLAALDSLYVAEQRLQQEIAQTTAAINRQRNALDRLNNRARRIQRLSATGQRLESMGSTMTTNVSMPLGIGMGLSLKEAMDVEKSMAKIAKFAPNFDTLDEQEKFLSNIKQSIAELSQKTGKSRTDIAAMYEEMGAADVAANKWEKYSQTFIKGAVALDMEAGQLSEMALGIMASTGHKGDEKYLQKILEQANLASDMGKMRAANVLEVARRSMGLAKNAGIDESAFIALTGAALDAGARDDVTGRAWKTIVARLTSTAKLTKTQQAAWDSLEIDPDVFVKAFKKDPIGQMEKLAKAAEKSADGTGELGIIIGTEFVDTVVKMGNNVETAREIQASLGDEQLRAARFEAEYQRMQNTTDANWKRSIQTIKYLSATLGEQLLPQFNAMLNSINPMIKKTAEWMKANPELTKTILSIAAALVVVGPLLLAVGKGISLISFLLANPIVAGIMAIAVAAIYLWQNWEKVNNWFNTNPFALAMQKITIIRAMIDFLSDAIQTVIALCNSDWDAAWEGAKIMAKAAIDFVLAPLKMLWSLIKKLASYVGIDLGAAFEAFRDACAPVIAFIQDKIDALVGTIVNAINNLNNFIALNKSAIGLGDDPHFGNFLADSARSLVGLPERYGGIYDKTPTEKITTIAPVTATNNNQKTINQTINQNNTIHTTRFDMLPTIKRGAAKAAAEGARHGGRHALLSDSARGF